MCKHQQVEVQQSIVETLRGPRSCFAVAGADIGLAVTVCCLCCYVAAAQDNDLLHKQNELLRSSEAAYQKEAQLVRLRGGAGSGQLAWQISVMKQ